MADPMDVDPDPPQHDTHLHDNKQGTLRVRGTYNMDREEPLIDLSGPEQEGFVAVMHESSRRRPLRQSPARKQKKSFMQHVSTFMSLSSSPSDGHEGSHGINVEELGACLQESLAEVDALRKRNDDLEKEKTKVERKNDRLKDAHQSLFQTNAQLQRQNKNAEKENEVLRNRGDDLTRRLEERKEDHRKEIAQLKSQIYDITRTRDLFRQMIVPVSEKQVPDFDVISKFGNLRSSIHELLRQTWTTELKEDVDFRQLSPIQQDFFGSKLPLSYDRLRSLVFRIIEPTVLRSRNYFLGKGFEEFEQRIRDVDEFLHQNMSKGERGRVMEWRNATFKATDGFRDNGRCSSTAHGYVWDFLDPLQKKNAAAEQNGRKKLETICDNAVELSLMIRQLKDDFKVNNLASAVGKPISQWEEIAEDVLSIPAWKDNQLGTIAYVIDGALIKSPKENLEKDLVLKKALVAVFQ